MWNFSGPAVAATVGALATTVIAISPARTADAPLEEAVPREYSAPETYRRETRIEEEYVYRRPAPVYGYVAPPPVVYYEYRPRVVVVPPPYYVRPYAYRIPPYVVRRPGPYVVRGVGPYRWSRRVHRW